jgi:hypothetical protein
MYRRIQPSRRAKRKARLPPFIKNFKMYRRIQPSRGAKRMARLPPFIKNFNMYRRIQPSRRAKRMARLPPFPKFALLPVELQLLIWSYLLPPPAVHELRGDGFKAANPNPVLLRVCRTSRAFALKHYTLMFGTKSEVYKIGDYHYTYLMGQTPGGENHLQLLHPARNYVDVKRDTVYINDRTIRQERKYSTVGNLYELQKYILLEDASKIKHLALDYIIWHHGNYPVKEANPTLNGFEERFELLTQYCGFRNLETLTLVVSIFYFTEPFSSRTWLILVADLRPWLPNLDDERPSGISSSSDLLCGRY